MTTVGGVIVTLLSLLAWGGQAISWLAPDTAVRFGLMEAEDDVEPTFWADMRGEATWDTFTLWPMVLAGVLLMFDQDVWAYFGLVGGGMYLYFGGRGILARVAMQRRGLRIGARRNVRLGFIFSAVWAAMAVMVIIAAVVSLDSKLTENGVGPEVGADPTLQFDVSEVGSGPAEQAEPFR